MWLRILAYIMAAVFVAAPGQAQSVDRVFHLAYAETPRDFQELAALISKVARAQEVSTDEVQRTLTLRGPAGQIALVEWLVERLNRPAAQAEQDTARHEYPVGSDDVVRVFYVTHAESVRSFQEVASVVRTMSEARDALTYNARYALVSRGTPDQLAYAAWLVEELNQPAPPQSVVSARQVPTPSEYRLSGGGENIVRVYYPFPEDSLQQFNELAQQVRNIADMRWMFVAPYAIAVRGSSDKIALVDWLLRELEQTQAQSSGGQGQVTASSEYKMSIGGRDPEDIVRVFYLPLPQNTSFQELQQVATQFRTSTKIRRLFTYTRRRALLVRATGDQMMQLERQIEAWKKPDSATALR